MRRLTATLLLAASFAAVAGTAPAATAACDPEIQNCFYDCLRQAHLVVDPKDPQATVRGLLPMCPTS